MPAGCFLLGCVFGYDLVLAVVFGLITLALAAFSLKLSKLTSQRPAKLFGIGFLLISLSYFAEAFFNFLVLPQIGSAVPTMMKISFALRLEFLGAYAHILLMLAGLIVLLYMTFNVKDKKTLAATLLLGILPVLLSDEAFIIFYMVSSVCLLFIVHYYIKNYFKKRQLLSLTTAIAFILLLLGNIHFFFSQANPILYVMGHILLLGAYILIFANFYLVLRK